MTKTVTTKEYLQKLDQLLQELIKYEKTLKEGIQKDLPRNPDNYQMYQADQKDEQDFARLTLYHLQNPKAKNHYNYYLDR